MPCRARLELEPLVASIKRLELELLVASIKRLVPDSLWNELERRRRDYCARHVD